MTSSNKSAGVVVPSSVKRAPTQLLRSSVCVASFTVLSRILGFIRDILIATLLGAGPIADALVVALRLPALVQRPMDRGALGSSFIPLYLDLDRSAGERAAHQFMQQVLTALMFVMLLLVIIGQVTMPWLMHIIAPGFSDRPEQFELAIALSRLTLPYILFATAAALLSSMLNAMGRFAVSAASAAVLNLGVVITLLLIAPLVDLPASAVAASVSVSGVFQLLVVAVACKRLGIPLRLAKPSLSPSVVSFLKRSGPTFLSGGVAQVNLFVASIIASFYVGGPSTLYYAERIYGLPLGITTAAIGVVLLPSMSRYRAEGQVQQAIDSLNRCCEAAWFVTWPAAIALMVIAEPLVRLLFERGAFDAAATLATASNLSVFALGLPAYVIARTLMVSFFSRGDTITPFHCFSVSVMINILLSLILSRLFGVIGIAAATAIAGWVLIALLAWRGWRLGDLRLDERLRQRLPRIAMAGVVMGLALWLGMNLLDGALAGQILTQLTAVSVLVVSGLLSFLFAAVCFGGVTTNEVANLLCLRTQQ